jgi:DNA-binding FadR family transcriptional regulator
MNINHKIALAIAHLDNGNTHSAWQCLHDARLAINECSKAEFAAVDFVALKSTEARLEEMQAALQAMCSQIRWAERLAGCDDAHNV